MALVLRADPAGRYELRPGTGPLVVGSIRPGIVLPLPDSAASMTVVPQAAELFALEPTCTDLRPLPVEAALIENAP